MSDGCPNDTTLTILRHRLYDAFEKLIVVYDIQKMEGKEVSLKHCTSHRQTEEYLQKNKISSSESVNKTLGRGMRDGSDVTISGLRNGINREVSHDRNLRNAYFRVSIWLQIYNRMRILCDFNSNTTNKYYDYFFEHNYYCLKFFENQFPKRY